jgi:hypothetical protein
LNTAHLPFLSRADGNVAPYGGFLEQGKPIVAFGIKHIPESSTRKIGFTAFGNRNHKSFHVLTSVPILYSFNSGDGKVVFSTFRVARNTSDEMVSVLQYMMYRL